MERYKLKQLYANLTTFTDEMAQQLDAYGYPMGLTQEDVEELVDFICLSIYGYFYDDLVAYAGEDTSEVSGKFVSRVMYDLWVKLPYWYRKYNEVKKLLTDEDLSMLQTSKVTSSSQDQTDSAGGSLQKGATTPTGVSATTTPDEINITIGEGTDDGKNSVGTNGFADKYTNHQQKFANASQIKGSRSGTILREGSIKDLTEVLEKLPSSFADEITKALNKHFIFDYDGEERGYYNESY